MSDPCGAAGPEEAPLPRDLDGWVARLEAAHPAGIELGLERVSAVGRQLGVLAPQARVVTVGGTNGKGSVARTLEALLHEAGVSTALYTSPHFHRLNERVRIDGAEVADAELVAALEAVEHARRACGVRLTFFEHTTLAALVCFAGSGAAVWILEVGLGGRLDAVNALDPDVAAVTRVALDHMEFLGDTVEAIAEEKAGIFRPGRPAVIGQADAPATLFAAAERIGAQPVRAGREYRYGGDAEAGWWWQGAGGTWRGLPAPGAAGEAARVNAATALAILAQLPEGAGASAAAVHRALGRVRIPGRLQRRRDGTLEWLLDVAHNADGAEELAAVLEAGEGGRCHAVFAVARRKDAAALIDAVGPWVASWYLPQLAAPEMCDSAGLARLVAERGGAVAHQGSDLATTLAAARRRAEPGDRIVVFGSFLTVAAVLAELGWE